MKASFFVHAGALILATCLGVAVVAADRTPSVDWRNVRGDAGGMRHSPLTQISRDNVKQLQVAWTYHTGDAQPGRRSTIECTPIVVDGVMYITTVKSKVVALDAATGQAKWTFDPYSPSADWNANAMNGVNRGVAYWKDEKTGRGRIFHGTSDGRLFALDAATGALVDSFAAKGILALREGLREGIRDGLAEGRDISKRIYGITSAPAIFEDLVIAGFAVDEGPGESLPGDIRAFDARTGKERWRFHTVPRPGEFGHETWEGDGWKNRGGVNAWSGLTVDESRGLVFAGLGSAAFDFYGGDRLGDNLFGNSTIALDARTGQRKWHFQTTRHDIWDMDLPTPPVLVTVTHGGRKIDAAVQLTKTGFVYVFDRATGKPLFPIEERAAPASTIPGERAAKSQPVPVKPAALVRQTFTEADLSTRTPEVAAELRERFRGYKPGSTFTPPSLEGTVTIPGLLGGANWSGASFDPASGLLFVNVNNLPYVLTIKKADAGALYPWANTGYNHFRDREGYPAVAPPWGQLVAVDLNAGEIRWKKTLGEYPQLVKQGVSNTGTENIGGTIVTAGGLVFIGATKDEKFRAFDSATGDVLWEHQLEAGGYATPATYSVNGRQFVVIAAGGGGKMATSSSDAFVAFSLPNGPQRIQN
jgi:quinoprotein glucose dehydrogenase